MRSKTYIPMSLAALPVLALLGCNPDEEDPMEEPGTSSLRVLHLSPDAPEVDVFLDGITQAVDGLEFQASTSYLDIESGTYDIQVSPAGGSAADSVLDINGVSFDDDALYTAVAYDSVDELKALLLVDDTEGLADGNIRVRAVHTAVGVGEVDIWEVSDASDPLALYEDFDFGEVGAALDLPAGAYTLGIDIDDDTNPDLIFSLPELAAGTVVDVFALSDAMGTPHLLALLEDGTTVRIDAEPDPAMLRVLHLSRNAGVVDVYAAGSMAVGGLDFAEGTDYLDLEPTEWTFDIAPEGAGIGASVLTVNELPLESGVSYTAVAYGDVDEIAALALVDDYEGVADGYIRVRAIHTASTVGIVDIWEVSEPKMPQELYAGVDFGDVGDWLDLPVGEYTLGFNLDEDAEAEVVFEIPELPSGTVANVFAVTDGEGVVHLQAQLGDSSLVRIDASL